MGSRTWMCTIAAPAAAAAMQSAAMASGVNGTLSDLFTVSPLPVTAQVMKTLDMLTRFGCAGWLVSDRASD